MFVHTLTSTYKQTSFESINFAVILICRAHSIHSLAWNWAKFCRNYLRYLELLFPQRRANVVNFVTYKLDTKFNRIKCKNYNVIKLLGFMTQIEITSISAHTNLNYVMES